MVVDATFPNRIDPSERSEYEAAVVAGEILVPPAGTVGRGDAFVLTIAERSGATVLSNDSFQEFHPDHPWLFEDDRLLGGKPVPGVGWVFVGRTPVKGPKSRRAAADAKRRKVEPSGSGSREPKGPSKRKSGTSTKSGTAGQTESAKHSKAAGKTQAAEQPRTSAKTRAAKKTQAAGEPQAAARTPAKRKAGGSPEPINSPTDFLRFITEHQPGANIEAEIVEFTSHGAYAQLEGVRCYVPLKLMADPAPRSPREYLDLGEVRSFVVQEYDTPRRGIVLALPGSRRRRHPDTVNRHRLLGKAMIG
ncbi:MAG: S1 RNA-binding domain-containing protein [Microthrixaceae bacterium]|nr:S1 RNA-binding domain-containing protein [Microthrixaceae bacterium]